MECDRGDSFPFIFNKNINLFFLVKLLRLKAIINLIDNLPLDMISYKKDTPSRISQSQINYSINPLHIET